jgi:hypothetical protein
VRNIYLPFNFVDDFIISGLASGSSDECLPSKHGALFKSQCHQDKKTKRGKMVR